MNINPFENWSKVVPALVQSVCTKEGVPPTVSNMLGIITTDPRYKAERQLAEATERRFDAEMKLLYKQ